MTFAADRRRDKETLDAIVAFKKECGVMPSYGELAEKLGLDTRSAALRRVRDAARRVNRSLPQETVFELAAYASAHGIRLEYILILVPVAQALPEVLPTHETQSRLIDRRNGDRP